MNRRRKKQFAYGAVFLAVLLLVFWMVWSGARTSTSQCADGVQNNGEEGLDCGGLCAACDADENSAITVQFPVAVLGLRSLDRAVVLGTIRNTD